MRQLYLFKYRYTNPPVINVADFFFFKWRFQWENRPTNSRFPIATFDHRGVYIYIHIYLGKL
jgi:hypothetical protein